MNDIAKKILDIVRKHPDFDEELALRELSKFQDMNLLCDLLDTYNRRKNIEGKWKCKLNSILMYYMGIAIRPNASFDLKKRRTYGRSGFPDIDMDFDYMLRHKIIEYLIEKYGREYVGNIGTLQTLKTKAAVRRAIKVLDPTNSVRYDERGKEIKNLVNENFALENEILKELPDLMKRPDGSFVKTVEDACKEYPRFGVYMDKYPEIKRIASALEGTISGFGCHAAGIIVSPIPLSRIAPMHVTTTRGSEDSPQKVIATQFPMSDVEDMGLIKFDVLGLSTKTAISWACKFIKEEHGITIDWNKIPMDDADTFNLLNSGYTDGCFQLEKPGMKECLKQIGINSFDDLVVAVAMYRPGPKDYIPEFAGRKRGSIGTFYSHPLLRKITQRTFGILVYQEQVMQAFMILAGLTASDGYIFMKGCAKKKVDIIASYKEKFIKGCSDKDISLDVSEHIWSDMEKFGGYAFNKTLHFSEDIITSKGEYTIEELFCMDNLPQVYSSEGGLVDIVGVYDHGIVPMYKVTFSDGSEVKCTGHHKFLSNMGILPLYEIIERGAQVILREVHQISDGADYMEICSRKGPERNIGTDGVQVFSNCYEQGVRVCRDGCADGCDRESHFSTMEDIYRSHIQVINIEPIGFCQGYDLEVDSHDHLYCLANGVINSNSHSVSYAYESYKTAYLKAHYPAEFIAARLSVETVRRKFDEVKKYERDALKHFGFKILDSSLDHSKLHWSIVSSSDRILRRPLLVKGVGIKAAEEIVRHQPYNIGKDVLYVFASKVGKAVSTKVLEAMKDAGFWAGISKSDLLSDFEKIRRDKKRRRGRPDMDMFA